MLKAFQDQTWKDTQFSTANYCKFYLLLCTIKDNLANLGIIKKIPFLLEFFSKLVSSFKIM